MNVGANYLRGATKDLVKEMQIQLQKIAQGAAMMTETTVNWEILASPYETLPNQMLNDLMFENMLHVEHQGFTAEEQSFGKELVNTLKPVGLFDSKEKEATVELLPTTCQNNKFAWGKGQLLRPQKRDQA
ncbi:hypothetical protein [Bacillus sp. ISL-7]|uniref:hypothetical protein n=1 Tax=Bacillus sp. ISL-7 TaxID=2819136 RepID=UPI001BED1F7B|nr:hypothetical protein [Bacillus sp. ISL-7]MBT2733251.1 hypothetical protein [Bacillus sp. ISL-7]